MLFDMTFKAYRLQHLWTVIRLTELSFSRFHPVFVVCKELRCLSAPLTAPFGSFQCLPSIGCIHRSLTVAMPDVLACLYTNWLGFLLLFIVFRPVSFPTTPLIYKLLP